MRGKADEMIKFQEEQAKKLQEQEEEEEEPNYYEWMDWVRTNMPSLVAFGRTLSRAPSGEPAAISQTPSAFARLPSSEVKKEEEQLGIKVSKVPPIDVSGFNIPPATTTVATSSTALTTATSDEEVAWDEGIDEEVERLLRIEVGDPNLGVPPVPPPKNLPKLGSSLLFKLPGGVTGPLGKKLIRAKEVERRLNLARKNYRADKRSTKDALKADNDFSVAAGALEQLKGCNFANSSSSFCRSYTRSRVL